MSSMVVRILAFASVCALAAACDPSSVQQAIDYLNGDGKVALEAMQTWLDGTYVQQKGDELSAQKVPVKEAGKDKHTEIELIDQLLPFEKEGEKAVNGPRRITEKLQPVCSYLPPEEAAVEGDNQVKYFDTVVNSGNALVNTLASETGWDIKTNDKLIEKWKHETAVYVGFLGLFDVGKTHLLEHLTKKFLGSAVGLETRGLSLTFPDLAKLKPGEIKLVYVDSAGAKRAVPQKDLTQRLLTDRLQEELVLEMCDAIILVTDTLTTEGQEKIRAMKERIQAKNREIKPSGVVKECHTLTNENECEKYESRCNWIEKFGSCQAKPSKKLWIMHNLKTVTTKRIVEKHIREDIESAFDIRSGRQTLEVNKRMATFWEEVEGTMVVKHFMYVLDGSEVGDEWNEPTLDLLEVALKNVDAGSKSANPKKEIAKVLPDVLRDFIQPFPKKGAGAKKWDACDKDQLDDYLTFPRRALEVDLSVNIKENCAQMGKYNAPPDRICPLTNPVKIKSLKPNFQVDISDRQDGVNQIKLKDSKGNPFNNAHIFDHPGPDGQNKLDWLAFVTAEDEFIVLMDFPNIEKEEVKTNKDGACKAGQVTKGVCLIFQSGKLYVQGVRPPPPYDCKRAGGDYRIAHVSKRDVYEPFHISVKLPPVQNVKEKWDYEVKHGTIRVVFKLSGPWIEPEF